MEYQKVFISGDGIISLKCPNCMAEKLISTKMISGKRRFKAKCTCGSVFGAEFETREKFRKQVDLEGVLLRSPQGKRWGKTLSESAETRIKPVNCKVRNVSLWGIGLKLLQDVNIVKGDLIMVRFILDNTALSEIEKNCIVRVVKNDYIGCEFLDEEKRDTKLGFYLL